MENEEFESVNATRDEIVSLFSAIGRTPVYSEGLVSTQELYRRYEQNGGFSAKELVGWETAIFVKAKVLEISYDEASKLLCEEETYQEATGYFEPDFSKAHEIESLSSEVVSENLMQYLEHCSRTVTPKGDQLSDEKCEDILCWELPPKSESFKVAQVSDVVKQKGCISVYDKPNRKVYIVGRASPIKDLRRLSCFLELWGLNKPLSSATTPEELVSCRFRPKSPPKDDEEVIDYFDLIVAPTINPNRQVKKNKKSEGRDKDKNSPFSVIMAAIRQANHKVHDHKMDSKIKKDQWLLYDDYNALLENNRPLKTVNGALKSVHIQKYDKAISNCLKYHLGSESSLEFRGDNAFDYCVRFLSFLGLVTNHSYRAVVLLYIYRSNCVELDRASNTITFTPLPRI